MNQITYDQQAGTGPFGLGRTRKFYLDGKEIGEWFCEGPLRDEYGTFHPNDHLKNLLGEQAYTGGDTWKTHHTLQVRLNNVLGR
jgi:hypothetical protein